MEKKKKEKKRKERRREKCVKETVIFLRFFFPRSFFSPPPPPFPPPPFLSSKEEAPCTTTAVVWRHVTSNGVVIHRNRENPAPLFLEASLDTSRKNTRASHASGKPLYNGSRSWFLRLLVKCTRFEPIPLLLAREKFVSRKPPRSGRDFESWNFAK